MSDPFFANVALLVNFETGSAIDKSIYEHTLTLEGETATVSGAEAKFGAYSYFQNPATNWDESLRAPDHAAFALGSGHYTIEGWFYWVSLSNYTQLMAQWGYSGGYDQRSWELYLDINQDMYFLRSANGTTWDSAVAVNVPSISLNTWYHVAVDWDGTKCRLYFNGAMIASDTTAIALHDSTAPVVIGGKTYYSGGELPDPYFAGYIDEVRITAGVARYASDGGLTVPTAAFPTPTVVNASSTDSLTSDADLGVKLNAGGTEWGGILADSLSLLDYPSFGDTFYETIIDSASLGRAVTGVRNVVATATDAAGVSAYMTVIRVFPVTATGSVDASISIIAYDAPHIVEGSQLSSTASPSWAGARELADTMSASARLVVDLPVAVIEALGMSTALEAARAVMLADNLGLTTTLAVNASYNITALAGMRARDSLALFLGLDVSETINAATTLTPLYRSLQTIVESMNVSTAMTPSLLMNVTLAEGVDISATELLQAIFNETVTEGLALRAGYVAPDGSFTAWAMNTRTAAVSEYDNYEFNSFARIDNKYVGANSTGLYELLGDTDAGTDIISVLEGGYMQFGGPRLSRLKAAYIAAHGDDNRDMVLKIETHDGCTYTYTVNVRDGRSTKVHMGKGQRSRYFAWTLTSTGQDFDLDTLEFVPLTVQRRV